MNTKFQFATAVMMGVLVITAPAFAQRGVGEQSGVAQQVVKPKLEMIRGVLIAIETGPCMLTTGRANLGTHLNVETDKGILNVHLGPKVATQSLVAQLSIGQPIVAQIFRTEKHAPGHVVAKQIEMDGKFVELRHETLQPTWAQGAGNQPRGYRGSATPRKGSFSRQQQRRISADESAVPMRGGRGRGRGPCRQGMRFQSAVTSVEATPLSSEVQKSLLLMREEEKLARDVYLTLSEKYTVPIFSRISTAESRHMAALEMLLNRYGLSDPIVDDTVGIFSTPEFTQLYNELTSKGTQSLADAYEVGALIEELDISDLRAGEPLIVEYPIINRVYQNLLRGSRNHLRAFANQLDMQNIAYVSQHLSQQAFDEIATSQWERGNRARW